jgi:hypothetical protein
VGTCATRHKAIFGSIIKAARLESAGYSRGLAGELLKIQQQNQESVVEVGIAGFLPGANCDRFQKGPKLKMGLAVVDEEPEGVRPGT